MLEADGAPQRSLPDQRSSRPLVVWGSQYLSWGARSYTWSQLGPRQSHADDFGTIGAARLCRVQRCPARSIRTRLGNRYGSWPSVLQGAMNEPHSTANHRSQSIDPGISELGRLLSFKRCQWQSVVSLAGRDITGRKTRRFPGDISASYGRRRLPLVPLKSPGSTELGKVQRYRL